MNAFIIGVLSSLCAAFLLLVSARLVSPSFRAYLHLISSAWRLSNAGINNIIPSRTDYRLLTGGETIANYLAVTKHTLTYVGFWSAKGLEMDDVRGRFRQLLEKGCFIELVILNSDISEQKADIIAAYLGISSSSLRSRLLEVRNILCQFKANLPANLASRFILKSHDLAVYSSCFIIDHGTKSAKVLVDIKLFGLGRESSFGVECIPTKSSNNLYERFVGSFTSIQATGTLI